MDLIHCILFYFLEYPNMPYQSNAFPFFRMLFNQFQNNNSDVCTESEMEQNTKDKPNLQKQWRSNEEAICCSQHK